MVEKISLKELTETAEKESKSLAMKRGDRVIFRDMYGIWNDLRGLTGVVRKINKDPIWKYEVVIDFPHLLEDPTNHMVKNDFVTTVAPSAIFKVKTLDGLGLKDEILAHTNRGLGLKPTTPEMSKLITQRKLWLNMVIADKKIIRDRQSFKKDPLTDPLYKDARASLVHGEMRLEQINKRIKELEAVDVAVPVVQAQTKTEGNQDGRKEIEPGPGSREDGEGEAGGRDHGPVPERTEG